MRDLTRQYRPKDWDSIVGQDAVVKILKNEIKSGSVGHVYLFCGPRGTGKTTTGRVFASYLNAQVIELDAASNNGVENIRDLRNDVLFLPSDGAKYKVYIIDEIQMVTTAGFNAFLKTLEEPPAHVIFILATTDPQKLPNTILSRCQRFDLKRITVDDIVKRLEFICKQESIKVEDSEALQYIARQVDGGMRDAIKLLQKCTSLDEVITIQTVVDALGSVNEKHLEAMKQFLLAKDLKNVIKYFNQLVLEGIDIKIFISDLVEYLKDGMTNDIVKENYNIVERMFLVEKFLELLANLRNATQVKTVTEIMLIKICLGVINTINTITPPPQEKINMQELPVNLDVLHQITDRMTGLEKRMVANEMLIESVRFQKR